MPSERLQFRVPEDERELLDEHLEETDISKSEALRRSLRLYLKNEGYEVPAADGGITADDADRLERRMTAARDTNAASVLALLWVGTVASISPPAWAVAVSGVVVVVVLAVVLATDYLREMGAGG